MWGAAIAVIVTATAVSLFPRDNVASSREQSTAEQPMGQPEEQLESALEEVASVAEQEVDEAQLAMLEDSMLQEGERLVSLALHGQAAPAAVAELEKGTAQALAQLPRVEDDPKSKVKEKAAASPAQTPAPAAKAKKPESQPAPAKVASRQVPAAPASRVAQAPAPLPVLPALPSLQVLPPPPPEREVAAPVVMQQPVLAEYKPMVSERPKKQPAEKEPKGTQVEDIATKQALPDQTTLSQPRVVATIDGVVYLRMNPRQTVLVRVGETVPGLGTLKKITDSGAQFSEKDVPYQP